jgi:excinuclease UvrABC nuclease subunit
MPFANADGDAYSEDCVAKHCPAASGVYVLYSTGGFTWEVIYVGEAENIRDSLLGHLRGDNPCIAQQQPMAFMYELVGTESRAVRRKELISQYDPTCV